MRKKIVAGNWKMNLTKKEALKLYSDLLTKEINAGVELKTFSSYLFLDALKQVENSNIQIGAQNFNAKANGAFTGEVSYAQLADLDVKDVLIGHSERRQIFHENNEIIKQKIDVALANNFHVIYCCGEPLEERENENHIQFVINQLKENIFHLTAEQFEKLVIAYEPIWAIGTGKTATPEQAEEMHAQIRQSIALNYSNKLAEKISILYGGSCNAKNAKELFAKENIDGGLIGGASLIADEFIQIANSF
jgi:triosephosphate isomerase